MGRKKSKRTAIKKKPSAKLETRFDCPVCNHEKVVQCRVSQTGGMGYAFCSACNANFRCPVTKLDKCIDIYHAWLDRTEESNRES